MTGDKAKSATHPLLELTAAFCKQQAKKLRAGLTQFLSSSHEAAADEEAVHDIRVTCRRLRVGLKIAEPLFRKRLLRATRRRLKALLKSLGEMRDAEVLATRARSVAQAVQLASLAEQFAAQRDELRVKAAAAVARAGFATLPRLIEALADPRAQDARGFCKANCQFARFARNVLSEQLKAMRPFRAANGESPAAELHALRIAMKHLRYSAEFLLPAYHDAEAKASLKALAKSAQGYQDILGELHDAIVAEESLRGWLRPVRQIGKLPPGGSAGQITNLPYSPVYELIAAARADQEKLRAAFAAQWNRKMLKKLRHKVEALRAIHC